MPVAKLDGQAGWWVGRGNWAAGLAAIGQLTSACQPSVLALPGEAAGGEALLDVLPPSCTLLPYGVTTGR